MTHQTDKEPWRAELRAMASLAAPVVVVQLGLMSFGVVDTMMLGHFSASALAAAGIGHLFSMMILLMGFGLLMGLDPLLTQAHGAGRSKAVAAHFKHGLVVAFILTILSSVVMWCAAEPILRLLRQEESLIGPATCYIRIVSWGNLGFLFTIVLRQTLQAMSILAPLVKATLVGNAVNALGNWLLIWGHGGLPEMGLAGSAVTTAFSRTLLIVSFAYFARRHWLPLWRMDSAGGSRRGYKALLALGLPLSLQISLEAGVFNAIGFIMGAKGVTEVSANQVTLNVASLVFMIPVGVGAAVSTRVGNAIGAGDLERARYSSKIAMAMATSFMLCSGLFFVFFPEFVARIYCTDPEVVACAVTLIPVAGYFSIFDGVQCVAHGILRGMADTKVPAMLSLIAFWVIGLPLGYWLDRSGSLGTPGLWWGLVAGLSTMALTLLWRIVHHFKVGITAYESD